MPNDLMAKALRGELTPMQPPVSANALASVLMPEYLTAQPTQVPPGAQPGKIGGGEFSPLQMMTLGGLDLAGPKLSPMAAALMGGRAKQAIRPLREIDAELERVLQGTDWHPMDTATRSAAQLKEMGFPEPALPLVKERQAAVTAFNREVGAVDKQLKSLLKGTGIVPMDVAMRGPEGMKQLSHLIPADKLDQVIALAAQRQALTD